MSDIEIVILESNQEILDDLAARCSALGAITTRKVDKILYFRPPQGLDALFLILPAAEKWGAKPIPGVAQVLRTFPEDQREGMPPYVVAGVVMRPDDPRGPLPETKMLIIAVLEAVREFNLANHNGQIRRLGFWADNLLRGVTPEQLSTIFGEVL